MFEFNTEVREVLESKYYPSSTCFYYWIRVLFLLACFIGSNTMVSRGECSHRLPFYSRPGKRQVLWCCCEQGWQFYLPLRPSRSWANFSIAQLLRMADKSKDIQLQQGWRCQDCLGRQWKSSNCKRNEWRLALFNHEVALHCGFCRIPTLCGFQHMQAAGKPSVGNSAVIYIWPFRSRLYQEEEQTRGIVPQKLSEEIPPELGVACPSSSFAMVLRYRYWYISMEGITILSDIQGMPKQYLFDIIPPFLALLSIPRLN